MALPKWITPAGDLGIIPETEYYQYTLDAYDPSAGTLVYSRVSGRLPLGIQVVSKYWQIAGHTCKRTRW